MDEGEARAAAQRKVIRGISVAVAVLAAVLVFGMVGLVVLSVWGMSQYGSNK